jgi:hypothetical protein
MKIDPLAAHVRESGLCVRERTIGDSFMCREVEGN